MAAATESGRKPRNLLRQRGGPQRVTNIELFFDLVFVFAITQLSEYLVRHATPRGAVRAALLLAMVWLLWAYTAWVTNWLDPGRTSVRLLLLALMLASLLMSAVLPEAFGSGGLLVGCAYAAMQIGRSAFAVAGLSGQPLQRNFQRILAWCVLSGALAVAGGLAAGLARELLWLAAAGVDLAGGAAGFWTPGLGRSETQDWDIAGGHLAERCQAFILIALGESIVVSGATLPGLLSGSAADRNAALLAALVTFAGSAGLWWIYFDRSAEEGARVIAGSADPGRLGRSAYHFIHPVMVAGIIAASAGGQVMLRRLAGHHGGPSAVAAWLILGGTWLYIAGHAAFKLVIWRVASRPRVAALAALVLLGLAAPHLPALGLAACATAVILAVGAADLVLRPAPRARPEGAGREAGRDTGGAES